MASITEILAEAFNRVKTEHGVTLSRVDFAVDGDIEFSATGNVVFSSTYDDIPLPPDSRPADATHYGKLGAGGYLYYETPSAVGTDLDDTNRYYKYRNGILFGWHSQLGWGRYVLSKNKKRLNKLVDHLTPLT